MSVCINLIHVIFRTNELPSSLCWLVAANLLTAASCGSTIAQQDTTRIEDTKIQNSVDNLSVSGVEKTNDAYLVRPPAENSVRQIETLSLVKPLIPENSRAAESERRDHATVPFGQQLGQSGVILNWHNHGGNAQKNGLSAITGPDAAIMLWENDDDFAIIAFQPYILDNRVFAVRYRDFVGSDAEDEIVAYDLETGDELWCVLLPYGGNSQQQWGAHILGVNNGTVYASRSGNGNSIEGPVTAYDAADGSFIWTSEDTTDTGFYGGAVFAPDGDLIVGSFDNVRRISAIDGLRVWSVPRQCPTSGGCPPVLSSDGIFLNESRPGGMTAIAKHDLETGAFLYRAPDTPGFISQNTAFVSPDGNTVYHAKQHNSNAHFLYAFTDTGTALVEKWNRPIAYTAYHLHGIGNDGSIYSFLPNDEFVRLDPETGDVMNTAGVLGPRSAGPQTAIGADGTVYLSNGWASSPPSDGRLWVLTPDLQLLFTLNLDRQNSGGPALGANGTLVISDRTSVRAYRTESKIILGDINGDGIVDLQDVAPFVELLVNSEFQIEADLNQDGVVNLLDVPLLIQLLTGG